jgi:tRNA (mo5U34)-methyltransferase
MANPEVHVMPSRTFEEEEKLKATIKEIPDWYHKIDLGNGLVTPGWAPLDPKSYKLPERLDGKRVLDIGSWDGYWTFEALRRGANYVVAIDDFSDKLGFLESRTQWKSFKLCRDALGYSGKHCSPITMSVYDIREEIVGEFDVVFFFGTLYHLRYPLLALDRIAKICKGEIYIESAILDNYSPFTHAHRADEMIMEFYPEAEYGGNKTNWWVPTLKCLANMVGASGFADVEAWKLTDRPANVSQCRGFVKASKTPVKTLFSKAVEEKDETKE